MKSPLFDRKVIAWALYDWANSAFATTVMVVFFPLFFKQYLTAGQDATTSTFWLGIANGTSSFVLAIMAPWLGALADKGNAHMRFLAAFTAIGVVPTALLAFVGPSGWVTAAVLFAIASVGFWGGLIFYDSMLVHVAPRGRMDSVSGVGYALGYLGGGLLLVVNVVMYSKPALFGLSDAQTAIRASFLMVAAWWVLFAIPIFRNPPFDSRPAIPLSSADGSGGNWEPAGAGRPASSIARSGERRHIEEDAIADALRKQLDAWRADGDWQKVKCMELLFVAGRGNKETAELIGATEQQVANFKFDFLERLRKFVKQQRLNEDVFPELSQS